MLKNRGVAGLGGRRKGVSGVQQNASRGGFEDEETSDKQPIESACDLHPVQHLLHPQKAGGCGSIAWGRRA
jgi:hypothetical protein